MTVGAQTPDTDIFVGRIDGAGPTITFSGWENVTRRVGYDNQPSFTPDGNSVLYTAQTEGQTDIYRHDLGSTTNVRVTSTAESEYSATVMPGGNRFSAIRVEADSTQRLWSFGLDGSAPELVLTDVAPVGYHAWLDDSTLGLFVLGRPATLQIADSRSGEARIAAHNIGRSLHRVPGRTAVSFLHRDGGVATIRALDPHSGAARDLAVPLPGSQDYAWTPDGVLVMGAGSKLFVFDPLTDTEWREAADLSNAGIEGITRLAVSPDGRHIAVVASGR
jgi:WD40 repeat protein